jgi:hypothetical protein
MPTRPDHRYAKETDMLPDKAIFIRLRFFGKRARKGVEAPLSVYVYVDLDQHIFQLAVL